ncbi:MAG: hypothetical protein DRG78_19095 [Epsilonproteobacteria bacterium]|nr:MAG: hypothetical protein DRG78_19095 [Campylobacterota bacterium]
MHYYLITLALIFTTSVYSKDFIKPESIKIDKKIVGIVKVSKAKVQNRAFPNSKYVVDYYNLGTVIDLEYCDKYDWCKLKEKNLYISKASLGVISFFPEEIKKIKKLTVPQQNIVRAVKVKETTPTQKCIKLKRINLDENDILDSKAQEKLFTPYYDRCLSSKTIKTFLSDISKYYMDEGFITKKPYLKEQTVLDGEIDVSISKGIVEDIIDANSSSSEAYIKTAFIFQKDESLNLRDLETSLEMINRVPSRDASFEIKPGTLQGSSIVEIKKKDNFPVHLNIGVTGEKSIRDENPYLTAELSIDNPLNINDIFKFINNGSTVQQDYQSQLGKEINYSFPLGSYLMEYIWYDFEYKQEVLGLNDIYVSSGTTVGSTLRVSKVVHRNQNNKLNIALSILQKNTKNYFSDELLEVSSYKTTEAKIDLTHTYVQNWGQLISTYSFHKGTDWFGARNDSYFDSTTKEKLQFIKHTLSANLYYFFSDRSYQFNSNFHLQYSDDHLYDNNKLRVGSYYTVRGYESSYYGDSGGYLKNDLLKTYYINVYPDFIQTISPFIGLDYGYVKCGEITTRACGKLVGSAVGFKTDSKYLYTDFTWSRALTKIYNNEIEILFRYNLNLKF